MYTYLGTPYHIVARARTHTHLPTASGLEIELPQAVGRVHELLLLQELVEQPVPQHELRRIMHPGLIQNVHTVQHYQRKKDKCGEDSG